MGESSRSFCLDFIRVERVMGWVDYLTDVK